MNVSSNEMFLAGIHATEDRPGSGLWGTGSVTRAQSLVGKERWPHQGPAPGPATGRALARRGAQGAKWKARSKAGATEAGPEAGLLSGFGKQLFCVGIPSPGPGPLSAGTLPRPEAVPPSPARVLGPCPHRGNDRWGKIRVGYSFHF